MALKFVEQNFERPIIKGKCRFEQMSFQIDPKQLSDLLDFVKFQNYNLFYGIIHVFFLSSIYSVFILKDRCREYRQLYSQNIKKDRIEVLIYFFI